MNRPMRLTLILAFALAQLALAQTRPI